MIRLLAPTVASEIAENDTIIIEMSRDVFQALAVGVQVAFEERPEGLEAQSDELWQFFAEAENVS